MVVNKSCLRVNNSLENEEQDLGKAHLTIIAESVNLADILCGLQLQLKIVATKEAHRNVSPSLIIQLTY
jgi:hypothetical protein